MLLFKKVPTQDWNSVLWLDGMRFSQLSHQDSLQFSAVIIAQLCSSPNFIFRCCYKKNMYIFSKYKMILMGPFLVLLCLS